MCPAICLAVRARHGAAPGGEVRRHVREPLYGGCRRDRPGGGAEAARSGLRSRPDLQTRRTGIHPVALPLFLSSPFGLFPLSARLISRDNTNMRFLFAAFALIASAAAQDVRPKDVREIGKSGSTAIPQLTEFLKNPSIDVRVEAVKQLTGARALDALMLATRDNEAEVQIHATDGLVNFYLPGYVQTGFGSSIKRMGGGIKGKFTDTNDQVVDPYVTARPDVVAALGALVRGH